MASWEVQLGNPLQMGLQWEYHYKWGIFKQAMFDRRVNIRKISQSLAPGGVSAKLLTLDGESLPAAQLKHLLSTVGAVGAVGAVGTHGTFMDFGHMEEVKQSQCFFFKSAIA